MRSFACIAASAVLLVLSGCDKNQNLGGGEGGTGGGSGVGASGSGASGGSGGYDPCAGKACGDSCTVCDPNDPDCAETAVEKSCNPNGECVSEPFQCGGTCSYNGQTYQDGETFPSTDGCNTCECDDGNVGCTEKACQECGGLQGIACPDGQYSHFGDAQCGIADNMGVCADIPQACDTVYDPVCGCDGVTYGNACEAAVAQMSIDHEGPCEGQFCGGIAGLTCDKPGEYCRYPDGTCQVPDQGGACEPIPQGCPDNVDPVCGCDGVTYSNACDAAANSISIAHDGAC